MTDPPSPHSTGQSTGGTEPAPQGALALVIPFLFSIAYTLVVVMLQGGLLIADFGLFAAIEVLTPVFKLIDYIFRKLVVSPFSATLKLSLHIYRRVLVPFWYFAVLASIVGMIAGLIVGLCAIVIQTVIPLDNPRRRRASDGYEHEADNNDRQKLSRDISPLSSPVSRRSSFASSNHSISNRHLPLRGARSMSNLRSLRDYNSNSFGRNKIPDEYFTSSSHRRRHSGGSTQLLVSDEDMFYEDEDGYSGLLSQKSSNGSIYEGVNGGLVRRPSKNLAQTISSRASLVDISGAILEDDERSGHSDTESETIASTIPRSYGSVSFSTDITPHSSGSFSRGLKSDSAKHSFMGNDSDKYDSSSTATATSATTATETTPPDELPNELRRRVVING